MSRVRDDERDISAPMPELPEVETVMRGLTPLIVGHRIVRVERRVQRLRTPLPATLPARLTGHTVTRLTRRAKYILGDLSSGDTLLIHLGMTGGFFVREPSENLFKHDHLVLHLSNDTRVAYHDPRRFGQFEVIPANTINTYAALTQLGPEPLDVAFTPAVLRAALMAKKTSIKAALLDQHVVAGLGNIYVSEALHMAGIHPERQAHDITVPKIKKLHTAIIEVLTRAIAAGGSTLKDYRHPDGELGFFQNQFLVYDRADQACQTCGPKTKTAHKIVRIVQNGRSTFYCPRCQG